VSKPLTGAGSNRGQSPPAPRPRKKGGNAWNSDREGLGWPPWELALLLVLPQHKPTTIPPFLRKARDPRKEEEGRKQGERNRDQTWLPTQASQALCLPSQKGGE